MHIKHISPTRASDPASASRVILPVNKRSCQHMHMFHHYSSILNIINITKIHKIFNNVHAKTDRQPVIPHILPK